MPADDELIRSLRAALEASPQNAALCKHLADLLAARGDYAEAIQAYRRALDLAPGDDQIKLALAEAYCAQGQADIAAVIFDELLRKPDLPARAFLLAARAYLQAGEPHQAAQAYGQAVARDPQLADAELEKQLPPPDQAKALPPAELAWMPVQEKPAGDAAPGFVERPRITFKDVGGMDKLKEEIRVKIIYPLTRPDIYQAYGKSIGGGILMYGPPGCGKTHLARATAGEVKAQFLAVGLHDVLDMWLGKSEQNLHAIFELARSNAPCVLFFDEVDALGAKRSDMQHHGIRHVINQFLSEMDGFGAGNEGVLVLAATNAPWHIDPALRRPGRFDRVLFVPPPDAPARAAILQILLAGKPAQKLDYARLAQAAAEFSGADLRGVVDRAIEDKLREAMQTGAPQPLTMPDLLGAIKAARPTTREWFETARNYAIYSNAGGVYDDVLNYLKLSGKGLFK